MKETMLRALTEIRAKRPLVHHITNEVTLNDCANATLAVGASPLMAKHEAELTEVIAKAESVVLNTGTLTESQVRVLTKAAEISTALHKPTVLDPVGVGISQLRRQTVQTVLMHGRPSVIKGNSAEINALYDGTYEMDSLDEAVQDERIAVYARRLAEKERTVVAVTGAVDLITVGERTVYIDNGVPQLARLTGTGCMTTSLIGVFLSVLPPLEAAVCGIAYMSLAGEQACRRMTAQGGQGTFRVYLHDALSNFDENMIRKELHIYE